MNLLEELLELFKGHEEAFRFLSIFMRYIHCSDDYLDEELTIEKFAESHYLASLVFSSDYFFRHREELGSCWHTILNIYTTSVKWEKGNVGELKEYASVIRHCGLEMILKVVLIEFDWQKQREIDELLRAKVFNS